MEGKKNIGFIDNQVNESVEGYQEYVNQPVAVYCDRTISYGVLQKYDLEEREITLQPSIIYFCQKPRIEENYPKKIIFKNVNLLIIDPLKKGDLERMIEFDKQTNEEFERSNTQEQNTKEKSD